MPSFSETKFQACPLPCRSLINVTCYHTPSRNSVVQSVHTYTNLGVCGGMCVHMADLSR